MSINDEPAANRDSPDPGMDSGGLARAIATGLCTIAGAKAGFLLALDERHRWFVEAATPDVADAIVELLGAADEDREGVVVTKARQRRHAQRRVTIIDVFDNDA